MLCVKTQNVIWSAASIEGSEFRKSVPKLVRPVRSISNAGASWCDAPWTPGFLFDLQGLRMKQS